MATCVRCKKHTACYCPDCRGELLEERLRYERLANRLKEHVRYLEAKLENVGEPFTSFEQDVTYVLTGF